MIEYISGTIAELTPTQVVIDNRGIGYIMEISLQTYALLGHKKESKIFLQTQVNQRDGTEVSYGFATKEERDLFRLITGVSGMGAASARMILSSLSADELREAILSEDVARLKAIKGIGLKSAQRIVLELKDKIVKGEGSSENTDFEGSSSDAVEEATAALQMLGFSRPNIHKAIQAILKEHPLAKVEEIIKMALSML